MNSTPFNYGGSEKISGKISVEGFKLGWQLRDSVFLPEDNEQCVLLGHHEMNMMDDRRFRDCCVLCYRISNWIHQLRKGRTELWEIDEIPAEHLKKLNRLYGGTLAKAGRDWESESEGECDDAELGFVIDSDHGNATESDQSGSEQSGSDESESDESESESFGAEEEDAKVEEASAETTGVSTICPASP